MDFYLKLIYPFEWLVSYILYGWHWVLTEIVRLPSDSGAAWVLSIIGLVIVMRAAMIPLFVKQIRSQRGMQLIQPEMQKIQAKYKGKSDPESRQAMTQETMDLYKRTGTNPFSSCLPILVQSPFFFGLFRVLNSLDEVSSGKNEPIGRISRQLAGEAERSTLFGAQLSDSFLGSDDLTVKIVTVILIVLMSATSFLTQRQLMMKNMPASALDNPFARQQKLLLYVLPLVFAVSGVNFPVGVLIYWFTTNVWSMGQQFYVIRRMPAPGSPAEKAAEERRRKRGKAPINPPSPVEEIEQAKPAGQRVQPKKQTKRDRRPGPTAGGGTKNAPNTSPKNSPKNGAGGSPKTGPGGAKNGSGNSPENGSGNGRKNSPGASSKNGSQDGSTKGPGGPQGSGSPSSSTGSSSG